MYSLTLTANANTTFAARPIDGADFGMPVNGRDDKGGVSPGELYTL